MTTVGTASRLANYEGPYYGSYAQMRWKMRAWYSTVKHQELQMNSKLAKIGEF
jgi:hypothetical protein